MTIFLSNFQAFVCQTPIAICPSIQEDSEEMELTQVGLTRTKSVIEDKYNTILDTLLMFFSSYQG